MSTYASHWRRTDLLFVVMSAVFLYLHLFTLSPSSPIFYEEDHLYFIHDAWRMYRGEALYRDFFEYTFPGTQVLYLFMLTVFGPKFWVINAVILIQGLSLTVLCLLVSRHLFGGRWYSLVAPSLFLFFGFRWFGLDGSHRMLSPIFVMLAIFVLLRSRTLARIGLAGAACALASYFTQPRGFLAVGAIAVFLVCECYRNRSGWKRVALEALALGTSFALSLIILVLPFVVNAGARRFFEYTVLYIRNYVQHPTANYGAYGRFFEQVIGQGTVMAAVMVFYYLLIPFVYLVGFVYLWRKKYQSEVLLIALVGFFLALGTFAPSPARLFQICMPGLIVLAWLVSQVKRIPDSSIRLAVCALAITGSALAVRLQSNWERHYLDTPTGQLAFLSPVTLERYKWFRERATEGEYVFEVYQPAINFPLQLPNPTQVPFLLDYGYTPAWQVTTAIENLEQHKPRFIIWDGTWSKEASERTADDHLAPLYDYLRQHYELRQAFTPYSNREMQAWQRK